jgi:L-malate glycosyltransferase
MKLLIVNNEFPPVGGGAGRTTYYLARELSKLGIEVSILTTTSSVPMDLPALPGVKIHRVFSWRKSIHEAGKRGIAMFVLLGTLRFALLNPKKYDLVYYFSSIPSGLLSILAPHSPSILSLRGLDVPGRDKDSFSLIHTLLKPINLRTWHWADVVTASSANLAETAKLSAPDLPILVCYNGIDTDTFYSVTGVGAWSEGKPFQIIGVSRLIKLKGFQYLIQAMCDLPPDQFQLTLVGKGNYEPELQALTDQLGIRDRVTFAGFHGHETLPDLLRQADLFVLPSYGDSYATAFLEAMACGVPVVGANAGGAPELIKHGKNGWLVPPHDPSALAEAIRTLASNKELRCQISQRALEDIYREHSWEAYARQQMELCKQVLAQHQRDVLPKVELEVN